jgi:cytochrome oxidase assembly protein ShyY1
VVAVCLSAARWQWGRALEKQALAARLVEAERLGPVSAADLIRGDPAALVWRSARLEGQWRHEYAVLVAPRAANGRPGAWLLTPLEIEPGVAVLVMRGWVAQGRPGDTLPAVPASERSGLLSGMLLPRVPRVMELGQPATPQIGQGATAGELSLAKLPQVSNFDVEAMRVSSGLRFVEPVLRQDGPPEGPLYRPWEPPLVDVDKHRGYMLQWLSFAAIALIALGVLLVRQFFFRR